MSVQPTHWVVRKGGGDSERGTMGMVQCVIICDTEEEARELGSSQLGVRPSEVYATRIISGAPIGG